MFITNTQTSIGYVNNYDKIRYLLKFWKAAVYGMNGEYMAKKGGSPYNIEQEGIMGVSGMLT